MGDEMGIQTLFNYYRNSTKKYNHLVEKWVAELVGEPICKKFIDSVDIDGAVYDILESLKRIENYQKNNSPITDNDLNEESDQYTLIKINIQEDIFTCIERKGFKVVTAEDGIKLKKR